MDDALLVGRVERLGYVGRDPHRLIDGKLPLALHSVPERLPLHIWHHVEEEGVRRTGVEERENMGMLEIRGRLDLGQEAFRANDRGQLRLQNLERDLPLVLQVIGEIDGGHATLTEFGLDAVAALEGGVQAGDRVGRVHALNMRQGRLPREGTNRPDFSSDVVRTTKTARMLEHCG
jgi:hypothetical protein